jgi:prepilin-type N-terminal cleavage/methylation domain-containing protein
VIVYYRSMTTMRPPAVRRAAPRSVARGRHRRGVTLVEIAIVLAIISILAAIGGPLLSKSLPRWRTRRAAKEFASAVEQARSLAIAQNVEYRVHLVDYDTDLTDGTNVGSYRVARGNASSSSTSWDILPVELDPAFGDVNTLEGTHEITMGGKDALPWVSIEPWTPMNGTSAGNDIVFSPRGFVTNPPSDFDSDGYLNVAFRNVRERDIAQRWTVRVSRAGMTRLDSSVDPATAPGPSGTGRTSSMSASAGSGYNP